MTKRIRRIQQEAFEWAKEESRSYDCREGQIESYEWVMKGSDRYNRPEQPVRLQARLRDRCTLFYNAKTGEALYRVARADGKVSRYIKVTNYDVIRFTDKDYIMQRIEAGIALYIERAREKDEEKKIRTSEEEAAEEKRERLKRMRKAKNRQRSQAFDWAKRECERLGCRKERIILVVKGNEIDDEERWFSLFHNGKTGETLYRIDNLVEHTTAYKDVSNFHELRFLHKESVKKYLDAGVRLYEMNAEEERYRQVKEKVRMQKEKHTGNWVGNRSKEEIRRMISN